MIIYSVRAIAMIHTTKNMSSNLKAAQLFHDLHQHTIHIVVELLSFYITTNFISKYSILHMFSNCKCTPVNVMTTERNVLILSLIRLAQTDNIDTMLLCRLLPVYTLDHINTSGTIEKLWESIEFCDKNNVELECLSHLAHHMVNGIVTFHVSLS